MPNRSSIRDQLNLQTYTLEYVVSGAFDGTTVAPPISVNPGSENYVAPDPVDGIYRRVLAEGENLGLVDLSLGSPNDGGIGDRYVRAVTAGNTGTNIFADGQLGVFDDLFRNIGLGGDPLLLELVRTISGFGGFYEPSCIAVPQGSYLGISGLPAATEEQPNIIRIQVEVPETPWDAALLEESCCCDSGESTDTPTDCPQIFNIDPSVIQVPVGPFPTITIFGSGFRDGLAIEAENTLLPGTFATLSQFAIIDSGTATVEVQAPTPAGTYALRIFDPADPENCFGEAELIVSDVIGFCPNPDDPGPIGGSPGQTLPGVSLSGTNMENITSIEFLDSDGITAGVVTITDQTTTSITFDLTISPVAATGPATLRIFGQDGPFQCPPVDFPAFIASPG